MKIIKFNSFDINDDVNSDPFKKKGFHINIEKDTIENNNYRKVLYTGQNLQLVLMSLKPNEEIGMEVHQEK